MEKSKKNSTMSIVIAVVALAVIGGGAYWYLGHKQGPALSPQMQAVQQTVLQNCKYDADFCKYAANGIVAMSSGYTMTSESTNNGKTTKMIFKTDGKNNSESTSMTDGKEAGSFISLDKTTYMKGAGETTWTEFPPSKDQNGAPKNIFDFESLKTEMTNATKDAVSTLVVKKVGTEACGAFTCSIFAMTDKSSSTTTKIWVDTTAYLARKMEATSPEGTISTMTFDYGPVVITKPSPVKVMPAFDATTGAGGTSVNMEEINNLIKNAQSAQETPAE
jgi:outer membrane lipoprotein-sorting protein